MSQCCHRQRCGLPVSTHPAKLAGTAYRNWPRQFGGATSRAQHRGAALGWLGLLGWLVTFPAVIAAHTALVRTTPAAGAVVVQPPHEVRFWFNEPIERNFSRIEVFQVAPDPATGALKPGPRIDQGWLPGPRAVREVGVRLPEPLAPGRYLVQWVVLAIDAHRTQGSFTFTYDPSSTP